jgi:hypothetical protein
VQFNIEGVFYGGPGADAVDFDFGGTFVQ